MEKRLKYQIEHRKYASGNDYFKIYKVILGSHDSEVLSRLEIKPLVVHTCRNEYKIHETEVRFDSLLDAMEYLNALKLCKSDVLPILLGRKKMYTIKDTDLLFKSPREAMDKLKEMREIVRIEEENLNFLETINIYE